MSHQNLHTAATLIACTMVAGCAGLAADLVAPNHHASVSSTVAQQVAQPKKTSVSSTVAQQVAQPVAAGYCESMWDATGMLLHETPEHDDRGGIDCVFQYPDAESFLCDENGGVLVVSYDQRLCVVPVAYAWACRWIGNCLP
jgi:hypothetical protein